MKVISVFALILTTLSIFSQTPSVSKDCDLYSIGDLKITNNAKKPIMGGVQCTIWVMGKGQGGTASVWKPFTLQPGESFFAAEIYQGNIRYEGRIQVPNPNFIGQFLWDDYSSGTDYVTKCQLTEIKFK